MKKVTNFFLMLTLISLLMPMQVFACACCAEPGAYWEHESDFEDYKLDEVGKISPATSILYSDAGYPDTIVGIDPLGASFSIVGSFNGPVWSFVLTDDKSRKAVLNLWRPAKVIDFGVDQDPREDNPVVVVYKELRFKYRVQSATGFLKDGIDAETTYNLVLQGRGNQCTSASDFSTYILQVKGNKASYSFFGKLKTTDGIAMQKYDDKAGASIAKP